MDNEELRGLHELLRDIDKKVTRLETLLETFQKDQEHFITRTEFEPVKKLVYGVTSLILSGVVVALVALVVR